MIGVGELLTLQEVAERLKVSRYSVYNYIKSGELPCVMLSPKKRRFLEKDVEEFLQQKKVMRKDDR